MDYFESVGEELGKLKNKFEIFKSKNLLFDETDEGKIREIYSEVNEILKKAGIRNNEPIGTIKLLHVFSQVTFRCLTILSLNN